MNSIALSLIDDYNYHARTRFLGKTLSELETGIKLINALKTSIGNKNPIEITTSWIDVFYSPTIPVKHEFYVTQRKNIDIRFVDRD